MIINKKSLVVLIVSFVCLSCQNKQTKEIETIITEMQGKVIKFPKSLKSTTTENNLLLNDKYKMVVYFDTTGCNECKMRFRDWIDIIEYTHDSLPNLSLIFIVSPKKGDSKEVVFLINKYKVKYPFFIDSLNQFEVLNKLPKEHRFHTFLINRQNKIVLIGSPIGNDKMWNLHKDYVRNRIKISKVVSDSESSSDNKMCKQIEIFHDSVNLGRFSFQSTKYASFQIKNKDKQSLIIQTVNTSCGCMVAKYDKKPISQGKITTVVLEYKPSSLGYFSKTADVVCNVPEGLVVLKISGEVVQK